MLTAFAILTDGLVYAAYQFVVAIGLTLIFGVMKILNVTHGSFYAFGAFGAAVAARHLVKVGFSPEVRNRIRRRRRRGARASSALIAANSFSMARAEGAPSVSFRRVGSASSWRTSL